MRSIEELTPEQLREIIRAYKQPAGKPKIIVKRIKALGVSVSLATTYLFAMHYISYDDKLFLDNLA